MKFPARGLYAITQTEGKTPDAVIADVEGALRGGAVVVQYRDKNPVDADYLARELAQLCHRFKVPLLINDNVELAAISGADGVHLGIDDDEIHIAREVLGPNAVIGVSCYNSIARALDAELQGADYVAFGRFFPSTSKPLAAPAQLETLHQAKHALSIPIVAIGGILPHNGAELIYAGANLLAVIGGVFNGDPEGSARSFLPLFELL